MERKELISELVLFLNNLQKKEEKKMKYNTLSKEIWDY